MTEFTLTRFQYLYTEIRDQLTPEQRDTMKDLIDDLTWTPYKREMVEGFCGLYEIYLVDGSKYKGIKFRFNEENKCFETDYEVKHPQVKTRTNIRKTTYAIPDKIVKYIR